MPGNLHRTKSAIASTYYLYAEVLPFHKVRTQLQVFPVMPPSTPTPLPVLFYSTIGICSRIPSPIIHLVIDSPRYRHCNPEFLPPRATNIEVMDIKEPILLRGEAKGIE
jgi:hypothetical protein